MLLKNQFLTGAIILLCTTAVYNQTVTRQAAISLVKDQIIGIDTLDNNIYMDPSIFTLDLIRIRNNDTIYNPYDYSWLFFIDEMPENNWGHDCSYIFIDSVTGNYKRFNANFFPFGYKHYMEEISIYFSDTTSWQISPPVIPNNYCDDTNPHLYALLFSGDTCKLRWNDLSHMYSALRYNGYSDDNIFVFKPFYVDTNFWPNNLDMDDEHPFDFDGDCSFQNIEDTLNYLQRTMDEDDILFFFCSTHGDTIAGANNSYLVLQNGEENELDDNELASMVENLICSEMIFILDACFSGGFVEELEGSHRTIQTCTDGAHYMSINGGLHYNYLTYAYATALKEHHPIIGMPWTINEDSPIGEQDLSDLCPGCWGNTDDVNPDIEIQGNLDGYIQTGEAFNYAKYLCGQIENEGENYQNHGFIEDILRINGILGKVENTQTVEGNFLIGGPLSVEADVDLTLDDGGKLFLHNAELSIDESASLTLGENTLITGDPSGLLDVDGSLITDSGNDFSATVDGTLDIDLGHEAFEITNGSFTNCLIESHADPIEFSGCDFGNSYIGHFTHDLDIDGCTFANSSVSAIHISMSYPPLENTFSLTDCSFQTAHEDANAMIELYGYRNYSIASDTIDNVNNPEDVDNGISVYFSGGIQNYNTHDIIDNEIFCTSGDCDNDLAGITIYSSLAEISNNFIHNNQIGIQSLNYSNLQVLGNYEASFEHETQRIKHNELCQIFASSNAFPVHTTWNAIYSSDDNDCYIVHDVDMQNNPPNVDVTYNYWGPVFEGERNLCPPEHFDYKPEWVLQEENESLSSSQLLYEMAMNQIADSQYTEAKITLQNVVSQYPEEEPAKNSLKALLSLEPLTDNDFTALKSWYLTDSVISSNNTLTKVADNLANKCDEYLGNFPEAIEWYENTIDNPETLEDSVFAIIDLEHLYLQMTNDSSQRSSPFTGRYSQFKPQSYSAYKDHRDQLIALLHNWSNNRNSIEDHLNINKDQESPRLSIAPNPFHENTTISYSLDYESNLQINIYNSLGQLIETLTETNQSKGNHSYEFDASELNKGLYFCTLIINNTPKASLKMIVH